MRFVEIAPGPIPTDGAFSRLMMGGMEELAKGRNPMGRFGEAAEMAQAALYLASEESSFVTGSTFNVDGGITAAYVTPE